jgi:hypothetical protein
MEQKNVRKQQTTIKTHKNASAATVNSSFSITGTHRHFMLGQ